MRTLCITISDQLYDQLKYAVSSRKLSLFVSRAVEEKLNQQQETLYKAYLEASCDSLRSEEIMLWDSIDEDVDVTSKKSK